MGLLTELAERIACVETKVNTLEERFGHHEEKQNGTLQRLEAKIESIQKWLIYLLGGVSTSLLLLVANLIIGRLK